METNLHKLWSTPIYESSVPVKAAWLNAAFTGQYERMYSGDGYISRNKYILNTLPDLKESLMNHVEIFIRDVLNIAPNCGFKFTNSWFIKHDPNDFAQMHIHKNSLLSGVYYIDVPPNSGNIKFSKNVGLTNLFSPSVMPDFLERNHITSDWWEFSPVKSNLILFPSIVEHSVTVNKSDSPRYALAFNLFATGKFGGVEYELEL